MWTIVEKCENFWNDFALWLFPFSFSLNLNLYKVKTIFQTASWLEKLWEGLLGSSVGFGRKFPEGGVDFLEVALVWKFPDGSPPKQTSKKFASEPPKTSKKSLQKRFHGEAGPSTVLKLSPKNNLKRFLGGAAASSAPLRHPHNPKRERLHNWSGVGRSCCCCCCCCMHWQGVCGVDGGVCLGAH